MKDINSIVLIFMKLLIILYHNIDSVPAILGGQDQPIGELTYHVAVLIDDRYACGGAILNSKHVISAGQCVMDISGNFLDVKITILYGIYDGWAVRKAIKVKYVYTLKEFRTLGEVRPPFPDGLESADLCILEVEAKLPLGTTSTISNVLFPRKVHGRYIKYLRKEANITGYGVDIPMIYNSASNITNMPYRRNIHADLKYLQVYVENADYCITHYRQFQDSHLCAISNIDRNALGPTPTGACLGDIGGPLVIDRQVVGVLQIYVNQCDDRRRPALYTRVSSFKDFIDAALNGTHLDTMRLGSYTGAHVREVQH